MIKLPETCKFDIFRLLKIFLLDQNGEELYMESRIQRKLSQVSNKVIMTVSFTAQKLQQHKERYYSNKAVNSTNGSSNSMEETAKERET